MNVVYTHVRCLLILVFCSFGVMPFRAQQKHEPTAPPQPAAKITGKVVDEGGQPISGAEVTIDFLIGQMGGWGTRDLTHRGMTGVDGTFTASDQSGGAASLSATKAGHYKTYGGRYLFRKRRGTQWEPWNPLIEIVLKPIMRPIPMYAKRVETAVPAFNVPLPYDLNVGDWVAPRGKGTIADIIFTAKLDQRSESDYNYALTVTFSNRGDGIQVFAGHLNIGSEFKSPRHAPEDGYQPEWVQTRNQQPGQMEQGNYALDGNRNYFFRVRTVLNEKGEIKSANYGKIYGEFMNFTYYLNPTPNDRNMEFDPKRNLLKGLKDAETVTRP